jgi:UDP-N-acetylglucosamine 2-epimerase
MLFVTGTRPSSIKVRPLVDCCLRHSIPYKIWNTHQHQRNMQVFDLTGDTKVTVPLCERSVRFADMILDFMDYLRFNNVSRVVVVGDTDSALAIGIAADMAKIPVAHVESGLRSFYKMPEESNRVALDHMSTWLFAPTVDALVNLGLEKLEGIHVGNIMIESLLRYGNTKPNNSEPYILVEMHRSENDRRIEELTSAAAQMAVPVKWVQHPRYNGKGVYVESANVTYLLPQSYENMTSLVANAALVLTDSGGLQVDACYLGVPVLTMRYGTEWDCTIRSGLNRLVTSVAEVMRQYESHMKSIEKKEKKVDFSSQLWDDQVSERIIKELR